LWDFIVCTVKTAKNIITISYFFLLAIIILTICLPENALQAVNIFKNLLEIP
jgi:hypothetical protein